MLNRPIQNLPIIPTPVRSPHIQLILPQLLVPRPIHIPHVPRAHRALAQPLDAVVFAVLSVLRRF